MDGGMKEKEYHECDKCKEKHLSDEEKKSIPARLDKGWFNLGCKKCGNFTFTTKKVKPHAELNDGCQCYNYRPNSLSASCVLCGRQRKTK